ncbi:anaphase-promoting complex, cyclosome, subunit 4-domain-containing protein [Coniella lustricola]|uniref:Anaphase-promoting complex subunit 4 n=1 Tax=Coniella lustricola TaxID=2025994 RepID=A0A2T3AN34_9PEZI|nr:anaphase-promoting complex, cyclosome, subunit 4-domain-containing protein [Coniella lustricola]
MSAEERLKLKQLSQSTFPSPVAFSLLAASPTLDLVATITNGNTLAIRRARGELVSSSTEKGKSVQALCWKSDGQLLAVGWDDGTVRLLGVENTKVVHRINTSPGDGATAASQIVHVAWARNLARKRYHNLSSRSLQGLEDLDTNVADASLTNESHLPDLPHALTFLEIDDSLPKISPLPVSGGTGDDIFAFSTVAALESMFPPLKLEDSGVVDVMVVGIKGGQVHLSIYDSFAIGSFYIPVTVRHGDVEQWAKMDRSRDMVLHASHSNVSTHCLLIGPNGNIDMQVLYIVPMDLRFVSHSPFDLSLLASKTTTLQKLLRYLKQTRIHIVNEWSSTRELPSRFLNLVQQDLRKGKSGPTDIVQALYHTVLTGHVHQPVKEWLVESIGDRGHKRWEKAVILGLESLRNLIHENMLPALERITLILSRLFGIAGFHEQDDHIGFTSTDITRLVDVSAALNLLCHKILLIVVEELDLFRMFSSWLRITMDRVSSSNVSDEMMEKEALLDSTKTLRYIEKFLIDSPMALYLAQIPKNARDTEWKSMQDCRRVLDEVDQQLRNEESGKPYRQALPQMEFLVDLLTERAESVFENIAEAEKRNVRFGTAATFELRRADGERETIKLLDGKLCSDPVSKNNESTAHMFTAAVSMESPCTLWLGKSQLNIVNGVSEIQPTQVVSVDLLTRSGGPILDLKFLDEQQLLLLCRSEGRPPHLLVIPFTIQDTNVEYQTLSFPDDLSDFEPVRMEVREANNSRGEVPDRVCLIASDGLRYKVYAFSADRAELQGS